MINERAVVEAYRLLLNRKPESTDVIAQKGKLETVDALVQMVATANEFLFAHRSALLRHLYPRLLPADATPLPVAASLVVPVSLPFPASLPVTESVGHADR